MGRVLILAPLEVSMAETIVGRMLTEVNSGPAGVNLSCPELQAP